MLASIDILQMTLHLSKEFRPFMAFKFPLPLKPVWDVKKKIKEGRLNGMWALKDMNQASSTHAAWDGSNAEDIMISGLSLALKKQICDWLRQTLNPSELKVSDQSKPELIHTSCRSESSNISLVVLDKEWQPFQNGKKRYLQTRSINTNFTCMNGIFTAMFWSNNTTAMHWNG